MVWFLHISQQRSSRGSHLPRKALWPSVLWISRQSKNWLTMPTIQSMFSQLMNNVNHVLHQLIPPWCNICYDLRSWHSDLLITQKPNSTVESDFIIRMLFKDSHWHIYIYNHFIPLLQLFTCILSSINKWICYVTSGRNLVSFCPVIAEITRLDCVPQFGENWYTLTCFFAPAFHNELEDCNPHGIYLVSFGPATLMIMILDV